MVTNIGHTVHWLPSPSQEQSQVQSTEGVYSQKDLESSPSPMIPQVPALGLQRFPPLAYTIKQVY